MGEGGTSEQEKGRNGATWEYEGGKMDEERLKEEEGREMATIDQRRGTNGERATRENWERVSSEER